MRKFFIFVVAVLALVSLSSCSQRYNNDNIVEQKIRTVEPDFFYVVKEVVKSGDTVWDRAKVFYGSGFKWVDVVAQNPFLQQPGRVWQDKESGIWYVLIFPKEELVMGSTKINPIFVEAIDVPQQEKIIRSGMINAWEWLALFSLAALAIWFIVYLFRSLRDNKTRTDGVIMVRTPLFGGDLGLCALQTAERKELREYGLLNRIICLLEKWTEKGTIKSFDFNSDSFSLSVEMKDSKEEGK